MRSQIEKVVINNGVISIGANTFASCNSQTSVTIPEGVSSIGNFAFYECSGLVSITISESVTSIGQAAFYGCSGLTSIAIPASVASIGYGTFDGCSGLTEIINHATTPQTIIANVFGDANTSACTLRVPAASVNVYRNAPVWKDFTNIVAIGDGSAKTWDCGAQGNNVTATLANGVLTISGEGAMADYTNGTAPWYSNRNSITSAVIEDGLTSIGNYAFENCNGLTSVIISESVTAIGNNAFSSCSGLTSVTISNGLTTIGNHAFSNCSGLTSIEVASSNAIYSSENGVLFNKDKTTLVKYPQAKGASYTIPQGGN